jgi:hypothetical protein
MSIDCDSLTSLLLSTIFICAYFFIFKCHVQKCVQKKIYNQMLLNGKKTQAPQSLPLLAIVEKVTMQYAVCYFTSKFKLQHNDNAMDQKNQKIEPTAPRLISGTLVTL